ncbi:MAG: hypothetical protein J1F38_08675 [Muribaculaceae bacterium]|nr:hypothetical protein [Muribaculaceae bacterium]
MLKNLKNLYETYCREDNFVEKALKTLECQQYDPLFQQIVDATDKAKKGFPDKNFLKWLDNYQKFNKLSSYIIKPYLWLILYSLNSLERSEVILKKRLLKNYLDYRSDKIESPDSLVLKEVIKLALDSPTQFRILDFMNIWGWDKIMEQDWELNKTEDGFIISSSVEKLITISCRELKNKRIEPPQELIILAEKAVDKLENETNAKLVLAFLYVVSSKYKEALEIYEELLIKNPEKSFLWHHTAKLINNLDTKIAYLCKSLSLKSKNDFKGNIRLELAVSLCNKGYYPNAKYELLSYRNLCEQKGGVLKGRYKALDKRLRNISAAPDNKQLYKAYIAKAEELLEKDLESEIVIKIKDKSVDVKGYPGKRGNQWILCKRDGILTLDLPEKWGFNPKTANGVIFEVKMLKNKIISIRRKKLKEIECDWIKVVKGKSIFYTNKRFEKYMMIGDVYVAGRFLKKFEEHQPIEVLAIHPAGGNWRAVAVKPMFGKDSNLM